MTSRLSVPQLAFVAPKVLPGPITPVGIPMQKLSPHRPGHAAYGSSTAPAAQGSTAAPQEAASSASSVSVAAAASAAPAALARVPTGSALAAASEGKSLEARKAGVPTNHTSQTAAQTNVEPSDDEDDFSTVLELLFDQERGHMPDIDRETVEEALDRGEWGIAFSVMSAVAAKYPDAFTPEGRRLLAEAIRFRNAD